MIGKLKSLSFDRNHNSIITIEVNGDYSEEFDRLYGKPIKVDIKEWKKARSLDANAYAWVLIDKLAFHLKMNKDEVYKQAIRNIGGSSEIVCVQLKDYEPVKRMWESKGLGWQAEAFPSKIPGCVTVTLYCGSSVFDSAQMSELLRTLIEDCETLGIPTATPKEIARFMNKKG